MQVVYPKILATRPQHLMTAVCSTQAYTSGSVLQSDTLELPTNFLYHGPNVLFLGEALKVSFNMPHSVTVFCPPPHNNNNNPS